MQICDVRFDEKGLVPVIVQDIKTNAVLMMAYMNRESLEKTLKTGDMTYYSRSREKRPILPEQTAGRVWATGRLCG